MYKRQGIVNDICQVLAGSIHMNSMSLGDLKSEANTRMNPIQRAVKALSDVFIEIMPGILAAALLTGLSSVLGNLSFVEEDVYKRQHEWCEPAGWYEGSQGCSGSHRAVCQMCIRDRLGGYLVYALVHPEKF